LVAFRDLGGVLLAINMLDEGVDIPEIDCAILVASTQNARQYVQRRGRILRRNPKKSKVALVWDLFVINDEGYVYSNSEVIRGLEFAATATNSVISPEIEDLKAPNTDRIDDDFKRREMND
jgi:superfamily II DNA or RNA helicase